MKFGSDTVDDAAAEPVVFVGAGEEAEGYEAPAAAAEPVEKKPDATEERLQRLESDLKHERELRKESDRNAQAWAERATGRREPEERRPAPEVEPEPVDLVEELSSGDAKRTANALKGLGFYTRDQVAEMVREGVANGVSAARAEVSVEQTLVEEYPDLNDDESDLFIETQAEARRLKKRGLDGDLLIETAANAAAARLGVVRKSLTSKKAKNADDTRDTTRRRAARGDERDERSDEESETERTERIAAQSGRRARPAASTDGGVDELNPGQKRMARLFGISEEKYKLRAKRGVNLSGVLEGE